MADLSGTPPEKNLRLLAVFLLAAGIFIWIKWNTSKNRFLYLGGLLLLLLGAVRMTPELSASRTEVKIAEYIEKGQGYGAVLRGKLEAESFKNENYTLTLRAAKLWISDKQYELSGVLVTVSRDKWEGALESVRLTVPASAGIEMEIKGTPGSFSGARNPGEFDYAGYYHSKKLVCRMKAEQLLITNPVSPPLFSWVTGFRNYVSEALSFLCAEEDKGIYEAVILGDKAALSEDIRELYQKNGIAHLLAVSGLHVSLIGMSLYGGLRRLGAGYGKAGIAAALILFFYGCVTGFGPSVFRAIFMIFCSFLASYLGRTYDLLSAMSLSLLLLALDSPFLLFTSGLQLSFGAVFAIGLAAKRAKEWGGFFTGLFIQILTYPIILYHFFEFPVYGIFLNLLVIPLMTYVVGSGIAGVFLYGVGDFLRGFGNMSFISGLICRLGEGAVGTGHYILLFYKSLCEMASNLPFYSLIAGRPDLWKIAVYYAAVFTAYFYQCKNPKRQKPCFLTVSFLSVIFLMLRFPSGLEVSFLDVGQGDGIFIRAGRYNILMDCGSSQIKNVGKSRLIPFLKSQGVSELDYVFVSHGDKDHINGIEYLLEEETGIKIDSIIFSCLSREEESCERMAALSENRKTTVMYMQTGQILRCGKLKFTCIYPSGETAVSDKNEQSLVLLAEYGAFSCLLTGDIEAGGEEWILKYAKQLLPKQVTILKAAHHGSLSSSSEEFLERITPGAAVLSYGNGNTYGHPSTKVVERLLSGNVAIWRTGDSGAVKVKTDGKRIRISGFIEREGKKEKSQIPWTEREMLRYNETN